MGNWDDVAKVDFAVFPNKFAKTDRHPKKTGKIEITRDFLKAMLERAKTGEMPVLKVAMWENTSKAGQSYDNFRLELARPAESSGMEDGGGSSGSGGGDGDSDDDFPF